MSKTKESETRAASQGGTTVAPAQVERALEAAELEIARLTAALAQYEASHRDVIAIVAHELRTPLTSIVGYADMVADGSFGPIAESLRRPLEVIQRNGHRLRRLADEMLETVRLDADATPLTLCPVDLPGVLTDVAAELELLFRQRRQDLTLHLPPHAVAIGAKDKLHQVVVNLLSNATKYSPVGSTISCLVDLPPIEALGGPWVRLVIENPGPGIAPDMLARLFEPFGTFSNATHHGSSTSDSSGLGLYIARRLIERHAGVISVVSDKNTTQFTVLLPAI
ncbi:MAG: HAMP domain-containing histidine kinase [Myxococcales bacterium]|nr:HAMP domain-containing histidine kinase [Myxococcales bacterium]